MFLVGSHAAFDQMHHVHWFGFHLADLVYTAFLFTVGISLYLSLLAQQRKGVSWNQSARRMLFRTVRLFLIGLLLLSISYSRPRFNLGTLQCIALASLFAFPFVRLSLRTQLAAIVAIYVSVYLLMAVIGAPGVPWELRFEEQHTISEYLDTLILGKPKGEEGVLSTFASVPAILLGVVAARLLLHPRYALPGLVAGGITLMCIGCSLTLFGIPMSPRLVTPSFSLFAIGWSACCLSFFVVTTERLQLSRFAHPLVVIGSNAIAVYVFVKLISRWVFESIPVGDDPNAVNLHRLIVESSTSVFGPTVGNLSFDLVEIFIGWAFCYALYRKRIFLRV